MACYNSSSRLTRIHCVVSFIPGVFLGLVWGRISTPFQLKNEQKLHKMVYIIANFLVLHFGDPNKNSKVSDV